MTTPPELPSAQRELVEAFASGAAAGDARRAAQRLLETSDAARAHFRTLTAGRFPRLPQYTIIEQVGKGGFGIVYKAVHHAKERCEALKVLFSKTPVLTSYFENEVHLIARLRHPNIATLHEVQLAAPPLYYTMEFVEGERLNEYLRRNPVSLARRIELIKTVASALSYAHEQGVVHRDIKPQNILIDGAGQPHIVDFGIAKKLGLGADEPAEGVAHHEAPVGTLGYVAPEQRAGGEVDARADIYSLGALLFNCITGEPARHAGDYERNVRVLRSLRIGQPEDLAAIIARCVDASPERRYQRCAEFIRDLDRFLAGRAIQARREPSLLRRLGRAWRYGLRHHPNWAQGALVLLVALAVPFVFWKLKARVVTGVAHGDQTVIIGLGPETEAAIREGRIGADVPGLSLADRKSLRMLHAALVRRLGAARPRVVAFDYFFPDCQDAYDDELVAAMRDATFPIVIGAAELDINGEPQVCERLRDVVASIGSLHQPAPKASQTDAEGVLCIQRGFNPPVPGLALAAFGAAHRPDYRMRIELNRERRDIELRFERREVAPGQPRFLEQAVELKLGRLHIVSERTQFWLPTGDNARRPSTTLSGESADDVWRLAPEDLVAHTRIQTRSSRYWESRIVPYEHVLTADARQLQDWFDGRAVMIGDMIPGRDEYVSGWGETAFGCQFHAELLDSLLGGYFEQPMLLRELVVRALLWCALAAVLVTMFGRHRNLDYWPLRALPAVVLPLAVIGGGVIIYLYSNVFAVEAAIAACGLIAAASVSACVNSARQHHLRYTPAQVTLAADDTTLPSTVLADAETTPSPAAAVRG